MLLPQLACKGKAALATAITLTDKQVSLQRRATASAVVIFLPVIDLIEKLLLFFLFLAHVFSRKFQGRTRMPLGHPPQCPTLDVLHLRRREGKTARTLVIQRMPVPSNVPLPRSPRDPGTASASANANAAAPGNISDQDSFTLVRHLLSTTQQMQKQMGKN